MEGFQAEYAEDQMFTDNTVLQVMSEVKGNQVEYVKVPVDSLRSYFRQSTSIKHMTETLVKAVEISYVLDVIDEKLSNLERTDRLPLEQEKYRLAHDYYFGIRIPPEEIEAAFSYEESDNLVKGAAGL